MGVGEQARQRVEALLGDRRVVALLQSPRVSKGLISLVKGVGRVRAVLRDRQVALARRLGMAPLSEVVELRVRLERAEEEVRRLERRVSLDENP